MATLSRPQCLRSHVNQHGFLIWKCLLIVSLFFTISHLKYFSRSSEKVLSSNFICPVLASLLSREWCHNNNAAHLCWSHEVVNRRCMQITISNQSGNHANHYSACNHWKYCTNSNVLDFLRGSWRVLLECHKVPSKIPTTWSCMRAVVLPRGYVGIYWRKSC